MQNNLGGLRRLLSHISKRRRWQLVGLLVIMLLSTVAELATLGAVLPFLSLLTEPSLAFKYPLLGKSFVMLGWNPTESILLPVTVLFASVAIFAAVIRILLSWVSFKFSFGLGVDLSVQIFRRMLYQPFSFHLSRNTSEIIAGIGKVQSVVSGVINPLVQTTISVVLSLSIIGALVYIDPLTALVAGPGFALIYIIVSIVTRRRLHANSKIYADNETKRTQAIQEGLGGIRDILIDGTQEVFINRYWKLDASQRSAQASNGFISLVPRYLIECIAMVLIAVLSYWLSMREGGLSAALPALGALAIGAQKLMPQMQLIFTGWAQLSGNRALLHDVVELLDQPIPKEYAQIAPSDPLQLAHGITLHKLGFRYRKDTPDVIRQLSLHIPRGSRVGFIGKTGSGKTTLIDLIMGLLEPTSGSIKIDGVPITSSNRRAWQACIAHVPQSIYLADATIAENIAFGVDPSQIDQLRVREAAQQAQLAGFIETLPAQYQTEVGERGVRLSGGQCQRIGLARALYKQASILVMDEATSALDDATENAVIQAIDSLGKNITVLMIAHRVSTLNSCDCIFELKNGTLWREGTYQELIQKKNLAHPKPNTINSVTANV